MIAALVSILLDLGHCARWVQVAGRAACADVRLDAPGCLVHGWHEFGRQRIHVCRTGCGAEGPAS